MYCAIIGDIIDSREIIKDRSEVQENFKAAINLINNQYSNTIASNFAIKDGDAFYGLLKSPENLLRIILEIRLALVPNQIRIGIGIGSISTEIERNESNMIDGSANSTAREAVDYLSDIKNKYESVYKTTFLKVAPIEYNVLEYPNNNSVKACKAHENFVNTLFVACSSVEKKWDIKHPAVIRQRLKNFTQREIADSLRISQPAVLGRLKSADFYLYEFYSKAIESSIAELWKELHHD